MSSGFSEFIEKWFFFQLVGTKQSKIRGFIDYE